MNIQSYDESTAEAAHGDISGVISGLEASLSDLTGFVSAVKSSWDGDEMEQYAQMQGTWDNSANTVKEILNSVHKALGENTQSVKGMRGKVKGALSA